MILRTLFCFGFSIGLISLPFVLADGGNPTDICPDIPGSLCGTNTPTKSTSATTSKTTLSSLGAVCPFNPCKNGGSCFFQGTDWHCVCPDSFTGINCEFTSPTTTTTKTPQTATTKPTTMATTPTKAASSVTFDDSVPHPCSFNPCQNGGFCVYMGVCMDTELPEHCAYWAGQGHCNSPNPSYSGYVRKYCRASCGFCVPPATDAPIINGPCQDKIDNCWQYGKTACQGNFKTWAIENCPNFCRFCGAPPACEDKFSNCADFADVNGGYQEFCTGKNSTSYAEYHCRKYCGLCDQPTLPTTPVTTSASIDSLNGQNYRCFCSTGFSGEKCETALTSPPPPILTARPCSWKPCKNSGFCVTDLKVYQCFCPKNYIGNNCEISNVTTAETTTSSASLVTTTLPQTFSFNCSTSFKADIQFLVDSSGSVGHVSFPKQLEFASSLVRALFTVSHDVRIGFATFSSGVDDRFHMNAYTPQIYTVEDIVKSIDTTPYKVGYTRTDLALKFARITGFAAQNGERPNVANIVVLITDGSSTFPKETKAEGLLLLQENVKVIAVGVGNHIDRAELNVITGDHHNVVFTVSNFDALKNIRTNVLNSICSL